jgi:hypothetical protein
VTSRTASASSCRQRFAEKGFWLADAGIAAAVEARNVRQTRRSNRPTLRLPRNPCTFLLRASAADAVARFIHHPI